MARYVDIDDFRKKLFYTEDGKKFPYHDCDNFPTTVSLIYLHHLIRKFPTADVAPRSEVAREIFGEIEEIRGEFLQGNLTGADVIVKLFLLKQKYTEDQK